MKSVATPKRPTKSGMSFSTSALQSWKLIEQSKIPKSLALVLHVHWTQMLSVFRGDKADDINSFERNNQLLFQQATIIVILKFQKWRKVKLCVSNCDVNDQKEKKSGFVEQAIFILLFALSKTWLHNAFTKSLLWPIMFHHHMLYLYLSLRPGSDAAPLMCRT